MASIPTEAQAREPGRAIALYYDRGRLTFRPPGPDCSPAFLLRSDSDWSLEGDGLVVRLGSGEVPMSAIGALLAARCGSFGLTVWWDTAVETRRGAT